MMIPDKIYNILKWIAVIGLPATILLVTTILTICNVDSSTIAMVSQILTAIETFLGSILGISTYNYNKNKSAETEVTENEQDIH